MTTTLSDVTIVDFPETDVGLLEHRGDPATLDQTLARFIAWRREAGLPPATSATYNLLYNDPHTTPPADFRIALCAQTPGPIAQNSAGVTAAKIPAGRCAMITQHGYDHGLTPALTHLLATCLPASGEQRRDHPIIVRRVALPPANPINEIFLPLA
jgi:AraC family transcriptional regulator